MSFPWIFWYLRLIQGDRGGNRVVRTGDRQVPPGSMEYPRVGGHPAYQSTPEHKKPQESFGLFGKIIKSIIRSCGQFLGTNCFNLLTAYIDDFFENLNFEFYL